VNLRYLNQNGPTGIVERLLHFFSNRYLSGLWQCGQQLTGGSSSSVKRPTTGIEGQRRPRWARMDHTRRERVGPDLAVYPLAYFPELRPALRPKTDPDISPAPPR
jgi:hypothetical protein